MWNFELFFSLWVHFFQYSGSSGAKNKAILVWKYSHWNLPFCHPQVKGIPRSTNRIAFLLRCNSLFSKNTRLKSLIQDSIRTVILVKGYCEKSVVCVLRHNPGSPKFLKLAIFLIYLKANWLFSATTSLIWWKKLIWKLYSCRGRFE